MKERTKIKHSTSIGGINLMCPRNIKAHIKGVVYIFQFEGCHHVKIGYSAKPKQRLRSLLIEAGAPSKFRFEELVELAYHYGELCERLAFPVPSEHDELVDKDFIIVNDYRNGSFASWHKSFLRKVELMRGEYVG